MINAMAHLLTQKGNEKCGGEEVGWLIFLHKGTQ